MAEINVQRKRGGIWALVLIGVLLLALSLWGLYEWLDADEPLVAAVETPTAGAAPVAPAGGPVGVIPVAAILAAPASYGVPLDGRARVTEVPTDRGFWIAADAQRMFVVIDEPKPEIKNVQAGQMVVLRQATVYPSSRVSSIPGQMDADTRSIIASVPTVLYVKARDIELSSPAR